MEFLPQQQLLLSRSNSKSSDQSEDVTTTIVENDENLNSKLQNELVATLKRSNLKKKHDTIDVSW